LRRELECGAALKFFWERTGRRGFEVLLDEVLLRTLKPIAIMLAALAADEDLWPLYRNLNTYR